MLPSLKNAQKENLDKAKNSNIKDLKTEVTDSASLASMLGSLRDGLRIKLLDSLGPDRLKDIILNGTDLGLVLSNLPNRLWYAVLNKLELELVIKSSRDLASIFTSFGRASRPVVLAAIGPDTVRRCIDDCKFLESLIAQFPEISQPLVEMLGDALPNLVNQSSAYLENVIVMRAHKYYSEYKAQYNRHCIEINSPGAMAQFFAAIIPRATGGLFFKPRSLANEIASYCLQLPTPTRKTLLVYLREKLTEIDTSVQTLHTWELAPTPHEELGMRIMHCIDKLDRSLQVDLTAKNNNRNKMTIS